MTPFEDKYKLETITYKFDDLYKILDIIHDNYNRRSFDLLPSPSSNYKDMFILTGEGGLKAIYINALSFSGDVGVGAGTVSMSNNRFEFPHFGTVWTAHNPQFDNTKYNGIRVPKSYMPISSYTFDVYIYGMHVFRFQLDLDDILNKELEDENAITNPIT